MEMENSQLKPRFNLSGSLCSLTVLKTPVLSPLSPTEDHIIYQQDDLFLNGFPIMEEIRRQGKLCDVTLKVLCEHYVFVSYDI